MPSYTIFSPALAGLAQNQPSIKLVETYTPDNSNTRVYNGEIVRVESRMKEFYDSNSIKIACPSAYYTITGVSTGAKTFTVATNLTATFVNGFQFRVNGSTGNDKIYTTVSSSFSTTTTIIVSETVSDATADGKIFTGSTPVMRYHTLVDNLGDEYLFVFTKYHIFHWQGITKTLIPLWTVSSPNSVVRWSTASFFNKVLVTNNVDLPLYWDADTPSSNFAPVSSVNGLDVGGGEYVTKAKVVTTFNNYAIWANLTYKVLGEKPQALIASVIQNEQNYNDINDGGEWIIDGSDAITGFGYDQDFMIIFKEESIHKMWFTGTADVFNRVRLSDSTGCMAPDSIINDAAGNLYFFSTQKEIFVLNNASASDIIKGLVNQIKDSLAYDIRSTYVKELNELWWAIPYGAGATNNNKILTFDVTNQIWSQRDIPVSAFGCYKRLTDYTWDTLPFDSWDEWSWESWDSVQAVAGYPIDLVGDYSGYTYAVIGSTKDDTTDFTSYFVLSTDFGSKSALPYFKRWLFSQFYFEPESIGSTITVEVKQDNEKSWQLAGTISIDGISEDLLIVDLPVDFRAKTNLIKISATNSFKFVGAYFEYETMSQR